MKPKNFEEYLKQRIGNQGTCKQYLSAVSMFPNKRERRDEILVEKINSYITRSPRSYVRKFAIKYWLEFTGKGHLYRQLRNPPQLARRTLDKSLAFELLKRLTDSTDDVELKLIFMCLYDTGSRITAVLNIEKRNVSEDSDRMVKITMLEKRQRKKTAYLSDTTASLMADHIQGMESNQKIFTKDYKQVHKELKTLSLSVLGFPISSHWFRHSRAIHLFEKGYDIFTIQRLLGHQNLNSTRFYLEQSGVESKQLILKEKPGW